MHRGQSIWTTLLEEVADVFPLRTDIAAAVLHTGNTQVVHRGILPFCAWRWSAFVSRDRYMARPAWLTSLSDPFRGSLGIGLICMVHISENAIKTRGVLISWFAVVHTLVSQDRLGVDCQPGGPHSCPQDVDKPRS